MVISTFGAGDGSPWHRSIFCDCSVERAYCRALKLLRDWRAAEPKRNSHLVEVWETGDKQPSVFCEEELLALCHLFGDQNAH